MVNSCILSWVLGGQLDWHGGIHELLLDVDIIKIVSEFVVLLLGDLLFLGHVAVLDRLLLLLNLSL